MDLALPGKGDRGGQGVGGALQEGVTGPGPIAVFDDHNDCRRLCQKISGGGSPPVNTKEE